jgi:Ni,Fe-hydrogenase III large subunit
MIVSDLPASADPIAPSTWRERLAADVSGGAAPIALFGRPDGDDVLLTAILATGSALAVTRGKVDRAHGYHSLTETFPAFQALERELHEQTGIRVAGHPWMKPIRFPGPVGQPAMNDYPWHTIEGKDVHEIAVGPIHAGVIEPGSFRFMCHGEQVMHLEIHLGYQHRAVEALLLETPLRHQPALVETIAGDSSIAHAWAHAAAVERLAGADADDATALSRAVLLELERIAMHLAGLAGMATDIAFLQGGTTYGRLRTTAINTSMKLCGSRFGRSGVRPGGPAYTFGAREHDALRAAVDLMRGDLASIDERFQADVTVRHRLKGVGTVPKALAIEAGLVGMAARASGVAVDRRIGGPYATRPIVRVTEPSGDCWARALVRIREMQASLAWLDGVLAEKPSWSKARASLPALAPDRLAVGVIEGWRGEVVHAIETDERGAMRHYKVQDPSLRNWLGLALAVRGNEISDFPICNKSFDLSYCGNDL